MTNHRSVDVTTQYYGQNQSPHFSFDECDRCTHYRVRSGKWRRDRRWSHRSRLVETR